MPPSQIFVSLIRAISKLNCPGPMMAPTLEFPKPVPSSSESRHPLIEGGTRRCGARRGAARCIGIAAWIGGTAEAYGELAVIDPSGINADVLTQSVSARCVVLPALTRETPDWQTRFSHAAIDWIRERPSRIGAGAKEDRPAVAIGNRERQAILNCRHAGDGPPESDLPAKPSVVSTANRSCNETNRCGRLNAASPYCCCRSRGSLLLEEP